MVNPLLKEGDRVGALSGIVSTKPQGSRLFGVESSIQFNGGALQESILPLMVQIKLGLASRSIFPLFLTDEEQFANRQVEKKPAEDVPGEGVGRGG
jgi:hypothetical protein